MHSLFSIFLYLGGFGLLFLGIIDSSFLFMPLGNDLLLVALTVRHKDHLPLYVLMASLGSSLGVLLLDFVARKGGEEGLQKLMSIKKLERLKAKIKTRALLAIAVACLAPPPFPFTPVVAVASAFGYPRLKLLLAVFFGRIVRFSIVGLLAAHFGTHLIRLTKTPEFTWFMVAFIALCFGGSLMSIMRWMKGRHGPGHEPAPSQT